MKNASSRLLARVRPLALAVLTINVMSALPADADTQVARDSVAYQELRAAESRLSLALSSADADQLSRLWADDFVSTMDDGHIVSREKRLASLRAQKPDGGSHLVGSNEYVEVRVYGDCAVVLVTSSWLADDKRVGEPYQATHVWAKRGGRWRLVAAHISQVKP
jgi:ketosteroid isomerase-like protein